MAKLTYQQLRKAVMDLSKAVTKEAGAIRAKSEIVDEEARDTGRVAEMIGQMGVDKSTVSETRDLKRIMAGLSEAAIAYASAGDTHARAARAAYDQAHRTHGGINEAVNRAPVDGIYDVDREWFRQE